MSKRVNYHEEAKRLVAEGKGDTIMAVDFPNPGAHFSADVYLDRHCSEHYDITKDHSDKLNVPLFIGTGSTETHPRMLNAGRDMAEVSRLVRLIGGALSVDSRPKVGSTVRMTIPVTFCNIA